MKQRRFVVECIGEQAKDTFIIRDFQSGQVVKLTSDPVEVGEFFGSIFIEAKD